MTRWLDAAWHEEGVAEVIGGAANPTIIEYFASAGHGHITSDEVSWCAAFTCACLLRGGVEVKLSADRRLLARSYLDVGTAIDTPRPGAIAVFSRGDPKGWQGHVGFVVGHTATHVAVLGGNQKNKVCVSHYPKSQLLGIRWPGEAPSAKELVEAGSRTAEAAQRQVADGAKAGVAGATVPAVPAPESVGLQSFAEKAGGFKTQVEQIEGFLQFALAKWPWVAGGVVVFLVVRMIRDAQRIKAARIEDAATGAHVGRER